MQNISRSKSFGRFVLIVFSQLCGASGFKYILNVTQSVGGILKSIVFCISYILLLAIQPTSYLSWKFFPLKSQSISSVAQCCMKSQLGFSLSAMTVHIRAYSDVSDRTILRIVYALSQPDSQAAAVVALAYLPFQSSSNLDIRSILKALPAIHTVICIHCKSFSSFFQSHFCLLVFKSIINLSLTEPTLMCVSHESSSK